MSDKNTTVNTIKSIVGEFCDARDWAKFHNAKDLAIGIATEASELLQVFRFKSVEEVEKLMKSERKAEIEEEVADVLYFIVRFAQMYDIDLSDALERKIIKNNQKYPIEKAKGSNKKYNEYEEEYAN